MYFTHHIMQTYITKMTQHHGSSKHVV